MWYNESLDILTPNAPKEPEGWIQVEAGFSRTAHFGPRTYTLEELKDKKKAEVAKSRYDAEVAGIDFYGARIATDDRSQSKIAGAAMKAMQEPTYTCWWKGESGWVQLDASTILAIADAVRAHVQACYDREMDLDIDIDLAETAEAVLAITW